MRKGDKMNSAVESAISIKLMQSSTWGAQAGEPLDVTGQLWRRRGSRSHCRPWTFRTAGGSCQTLVQ